jgi:(p)ppGpp synthase/HD superfamily hydrolase
MAIRSSTKKVEKQKTTTRSASGTTKSKRTVISKPVAIKKTPVKSNLPSASFFSYELLKHGDLAWQIERFEKLLKKLSPADAVRVQKAKRFAEERHKKQTRSDGTLFIIHPVRIANILIAEWSERDADVIIAGLLHDVIEDTQTTTREVKDAFGDVAAKLVDGMTMWKGSESPEVYLQRIARGTEKLRLIKCADVLDNLRSWHGCPKDVVLKFPRWWRQTKDYVVPIAEATHKPAAKLIREIIEDPWYLKQAKMD